MQRPVETGSVLLLTVFASLSFVGTLIAPMFGVVGDRIGPRRPGDPSRLVADPSRARELLGWSARYTDIDAIVRTAVEWRLNPRFGAHFAPDRRVA